MTPMSDSEPIDYGFYLPHHAVVKSFSLTTKVRTYLTVLPKHTLVFSSTPESFLTASTILKRDFYVDEVLTGAQSFQDAISLRDDLVNLLKKAVSISGNGNKTIPN